MIVAALSDPSWHALRNAAGWTRRNSPYRPLAGRHVNLEPIRVVAALGVATKHIGLISTATAIYTEPQNPALGFATIHLISGGRAGWNPVSSQVEDDVGNFGLELDVDHVRRSARRVPRFAAEQQEWLALAGESLLVDYW